MAQIFVTINWTTLDELGDYVERIDGSVCANGSRLERTGPNEFVVMYRGERGNDRPILTPAEAATFVRNYLDEGFEDPLRIV